MDELEKKIIRNLENEILSEKDKFKANVIAGIGTCIAAIILFIFIFCFWENEIKSVFY